MTTAAGVGFIGLGQIGQPMALRLIDWSGGLWVCDVDPKATIALQELGANVVATPRELAEHVSFVSVMVRDDDQVREVLCGPDGILAGAPASHHGGDGDGGLVVAIHSTIHPDTARELAELASRQGVSVLDAPVSGGAMGARNGRLAIMVGGDIEAYASSRDALARMGELVLHLGPVGAGTQAKLARNLLHFVAFTAATEAQRLAEAAGIDLLALGRIVRHTDAITGGPGAIMLRESTAPVPEDDNWRPILEHVWALGEKDLALAIELGDQLGVDTPLAHLAYERLGPGLGLTPMGRTE